MKSILLKDYIIVLTFFLSSTMFAQHFTPISMGASTDNMNFVVKIATINDNNLEADDEIAVFYESNGVEVCVGVLVLDGEINGDVNFIAYVDDPDTEDIEEGFTDGSPIIYRFWDNRKKMEVTVIEPEYDPLLDDVFTFTGTALLNSLAGSVKTWTGNGTDNNWHTDANWNPSIYPRPTDDLLIPAGLTNYPTLSAPGYCKNITFQSNASGNATILGNDLLTVDKTATVQRYYQGHYNVFDEGWHNISSPVSNMSISGTDYDFTHPSYDDLYQWNETSSMWENYKAGEFDSFENGRGYLCALEFEGTKSFVGDLNESGKTWEDLPKTTGKGEGWHLLGNPFASALKWNDGTNWAITDVASKAKIWNESIGNYSDLSIDDIIPSTNGFFVQVVNETNSITISPSSCVHNASNNYKKSAAFVEETLQLTISNDANSYYDVNSVGFKENATEDWDYQFDSHKLFGNTSAPQLWTVTNDDIFSQNYLPHPEGIYEVQLNFSAGVNTTYHLNFEGMGSFLDGTTIFLQDLATNEIINLNEQSSYDFTATTEDDVERFVLHFNGVTSVENLPDQSTAQIYSSRNTVYVQFSDMPKESSQIEIFNTVGQQVFSGIIEPSYLKTIQLDESPGVYIVRLKVKDSWLTHKVTFN